MKKDLTLLYISIMLNNPLEAKNRMQPELFEVPEIRSSWDDLTEGIKTQTDWRERRKVLKARYLDLIRDQHKPARPALALQVHENVVVHDQYERKLIYGWMDTHLKPPEATRREFSGLNM